MKGTSVFDLNQQLLRGAKFPSKSEIIYISQYCVFYFKFSDEVMFMNLMYSL